jgi:hypothetical protein
LRSVSLFLIFVCCLTTLCRAQQQSPTQSTSTAQDICKAKGIVPPDKCYQIDTADVKTQGLRQATVVSGDRVYVAITRKPTEKCTLQTKAEPVVPEAGAEAFFKILSGAVVPAAAAAEADTCKSAADSDPTIQGQPRPSEIITFDKDSDVLFTLILEFKGRIKIARQNHIDTAKELIAFQNCKDRVGAGAQDFCADKNLFVAAQGKMQNDIDTLLSAPIPTSTVVDLQFQKVQDELKALKDPLWFANKAKQLSCYSALIAGAKAVLADLGASRQQFTKAIDIVRSMTWPTDEPKLIPPQKNAKVTATLTCINLLTSDPAMDPVNLVITYKSIPITTVDVGVLVSLVRKQVIGTTNIQTGVNSSGVPTFKTVFAVTDSAPLQAIPFSFVNLTVYHWRLKYRILTASASGGIGVNPNSGTKEVEFFAGSGFAIGNLFLHFGAHFGEFKNLGGGFSIGETVPPSFGTVPIHKGYTIHPGFALAYRIPLP